MVNRTRKAGARTGIFRRLWSPFGHLLMAGSESVGAVTNTAKGVVGVGARGVNRVGRSITGHFDEAAKNLFKRRKTIGGRRGRATRRRRAGRSTRRVRKH